jgi:zinc/manganese transport system permease protein
VQLGWLVSVSVVVLVGMAVIWRPLTFVSADPEVAAARGVPAGLLSVVFTLMLALAVSMAVQVVGALLVLSLLVTPAAAAFRVTASPVLAPVLSAAFAIVSAVGGILVALGSSIPISPFVTTISFVIYLVCRVLSTRRTRAGWGRREPTPASTPVAAPTP